MDRDDPSPWTDEDHCLPVNTAPRGGTFQLVVKGRASEPLPYDASPEMVDAAYQRLVAPEPSTEA